MAKSNRPKFSDDEEFDRHVADTRAKLHQSKTPEEYAGQMKKLFARSKQKDVLAIAALLAEFFDDAI